jgi:serine/threonine protein kinase
MDKQGWGGGVEVEGWVDKRSGLRANCATCALQLPCTASTSEYTSSCLGHTCLQRMHGAGSICLAGGAHPSMPVDVLRCGQGCRAFEHTRGVTTLCLFPAPRLLIIALLLLLLLLPPLCLLLQCDTYVGTMSYMSPERLRNEPYSYPGDIW